MDSLFLGFTTALWLGVLTSISPCPLATNIAAISFIGRDLSATRKVVLSGFLYTFGRVLAYTALGALLVASLLSVSDISFFLQHNMNKILGPVLILVGMFLLGLINLKFPGMGVSGKMQDRLASTGTWGPLLMGVVFALSFCPVSAALFFGSLIPVAVENQSPILLPVIYGIGTGLPVLIIALVAALGARSIGSIFNQLTLFEKWARRVTGVVFILVGIYYCLIYIFKLIE